MVKCCPECGHPVEKLNEVMAELSKLELTVFYYLKRAGIGGLSVNDLVDLVYADSPDGGPSSARNLMSVMRHRINGKIKKYDLFIHSTMGHGSRYILRSTARPAAKGETDAVQSH